MITYNAHVVTKDRTCGAISHQMERRQLCLVFADQVKHVGFKVSSDCV